MANEIKIRVRDIKTGEIFDVDACDNTAHVKTRDGVRVKLHPVALRQFVPERGTFNASTLLGPRAMVRM